MITKLKWLVLLSFLCLVTTLTAQTTISTETELRTFAAAVNSGTSYNGQTVVLTADIALTESWTPIGTAEHPFCGAFEGWGHKVSGLSITGSNDYQGLFGYVQGGSIRDVAVAGTVTGGQYVGGICGALVESGEISSCYSEVTLSGTSHVGGICGSSAGKVENCYNTGAITSTAAGEACVGGLVGELTGSTLDRCYNTAAITKSGSSYFGSIVGKITSGTVTNCIYNSETATISDVYDDSRGIGDSDGPDDNETVVGKTTEAMNTKSTWDSFNEYSYNTVWKIEDSQYPLLYSFLKDLPITFNFTTKTWLTVVPNGNYALPDGMKAYKVSNVEGKTVTLSSVSTLNEGCPAILYSESGTTLTATTTSGTLADYSDDQWLKGSHVSPVTIGTGTDINKDFILKDGQFIAANGELARGKAYLHLDAVPSGARSLDILFDDQTTGIVGVGASSSNDVLFDLSGRKLAAATSKGLMIKNGKKLWKR